MHIRPAKPEDFSSTASMSVDAFWNDELYAYTNTWRGEYPDHFRDLFLRRHRQLYWTPGYIVFVAVTDAEDNGHTEGGTVVGYAIWERRGTNDIARSWQKDTLWGLLERTLLQATEKYMTFISADKSLDYERLQNFFSDAKSDFQAISELWKLQNLCIHVDYQRRGIGSMFIKWGQEQAEREGVPIGLESAEAARPVYLKNGFRVYGYLNIKDFPIQEVPIFLWEPEGMKGLWGTKEEPRIGWENYTGIHPSGDDCNW
ncbi:hypothetical protein P7C71_g1721, partial [Lecanoromycetidae sp. Uapishka_2]